MNRIYNMDCLYGMRDIPDGSVQLVCTDLPYGTTANKWDSVIPIDKLWKQWRRVLTPNGTVLLFGTEPFSTSLRMSAMDLYKYDWIWHKSSCTGFQHAKNMPLKDYEIISVFSKGKMGHRSLLGEKRMIYNPQGTEECHVVRKGAKNRFGNLVGKRPSNKDVTIATECNYPRMVLEYKKDPKPIHPTQKPLALVEYLIRTYSVSGGWFWTVAWEVAQPP